MIIVHEPELTSHNGATRLAARIDVPGFGTRQMWFEGEGEAGSFLSERADAFAALSVPIASTLGEPLEVRGAVSPRLAWGLRELLGVHCLWWPESSRRVELVFPRLEEIPERAAAVACGFSGGVDSLFTVLRHLPRNEPTPGYALTHLVMINGFDLDDRLADPHWFEVLRETYAPLAEAEGLRLVTIRMSMSNLTQLGVAWPSWLGSILAAPALALASGFRRYYIGSAEGCKRLGAYGSSPLTDPFHSTDTLQIIHDGGESTRIQKLDAIAGWPITWDRLRVCRTRRAENVNVKGRAIENCGACEKCVRTMLALSMLGKLDRFTTFQRRLTQRSIIVTRPSNLATFYTRENLQFSLRTRRYGLTAPLLGNLLLLQTLRMLQPLKRRMRGMIRGGLKAGRGAVVPR